MPDVITDSTQVPAGLDTFYDRVIIRSATPRLVHTRHAQEAMLDSKSGTIYKWHRYEDLTDATTPLPEGTDPDAQPLSNISLTAQVAWYGTYVKITDVVDLTNQDPVLTNIAGNKLGRNEGKTFDTLARDVIAATASQVNASGGANGSTPTEITRSDVDGIVQTLLDNDAEFTSPMIAAGSGQGTMPVRSSFWGIIKSTIVMDLEACVGFRGVSEYGAQMGVDPDEWGAVGNVRFLHSSNAKSISGSPTVYPIPIYGKDAVGTVNLGKTKNVVHGFNDAGSPLNRYATSGWIAPWACRLLNDIFIIALRVSASS
jgi:N4-gp56 family major capsid protein